MLCRQRLHVRHRRKWISLLSHKAIRVLLTILLTLVILIPAGTLMKILVHLSIQLTNYPGGIYEIWTSGSFTNLIKYSTQNSIRQPFSYAQQVVLGTHKVIYAPFPVCYRSTGYSETHSLVSNQLLYYMLFPFADERMWHFLLCRLEHIHLGFFLVGSVNNICFTYKILSDMFDIILTTQQQQADEQDLRGALMQRAAKLIKGLLLIYCCTLVVLFWAHFNLFAFQVDTKGDVDIYSTRQFLIELPLWSFRWVTLGIALVDFAVRNIYGSLANIIDCIEDEEIVSLAENE
ncbi:hypothetical protein K492DRAFT_211365 [Lichtheimia hyalospora FSU 10163]|nr:hypothetical protein K492DRAFT_211365 [Lichtheimia hyalospora FSU 10163]